MRSFGRFRGGRAKDGVSLPGGMQVPRSSARSYRAHRSARCLALAGILIFLVMVGSFIYATRGDHPGSGAGDGAPQTPAERGRQEDARKAQQQWTTSPPGYEDLPEDSRKPAVPNQTQASALTSLRDREHKASPPPPSPTRRGDTVKATTTSVAPLPAASLPCLRCKRGQFEPSHPEQLPGLTVRHRTFTPQELLSLHQGSTVVYSFVNGSEPNHFYRKLMLRQCTQHMMDREATWFQHPERYYKSRAVPSAEQQQHMLEGEAGGGAEHEFEGWLAGPCLPTFLKGGPLRTMGDVWQLTSKASEKGADNRDRETDELRHSLRSVEQHIRWHRGRVVLVSPGHHPLWMDGAKNFLAGSCGGAAVGAQRERGAHLRVTTVHQDALMPYGLKLTVNSHVIEQHLWRVANISAVHVYFNDDYFVNRDVAITDLFNEYGGTIVRTEAAPLGVGELGDESASWIKGVRHTHLFTILEIDESPESHLPDSLKEMWKTVRGVGAGGRNDTASLATVPIPGLAELIDTAYEHRAEPMPSVKRSSVTQRYFATHAPFVYCTNMFSFLGTRYEREFALNALTHRGRKARDLFIPFVYNAFIMARPWQASPKVLPYLLQKEQAQAAGVAGPRVLIELDNSDGCAPATLRPGMPDSECLFGKFMDDANHNQRTIDSIGTSNPLYFNINAGFAQLHAAKQLLGFLQRKFPTPIYLERGVAPVSAEDEALPPLYAALMELPVVAVTSFAEGVCPLVRSLQLALRDHRGVVVPVVARHGTGGDVDVTLSELRADLRHRVRNAMPVVACAYGARVRALRGAVPVPESAAAAAGGAALVRVVGAALAELAANGTAVAGVELPRTCGGGGGVRVRAIVLDARAERLPVRDARSLRHAVSMPGQTLALEDFDVVRLPDGDAVLVLSRGSAAAKAVHWIDGAAESDLLVTYPIPYEPYEDLQAPLAWSGMEP